MKLVGVDEVDGGARALHLHHPLPWPHCVEHGAASVCGALTTDCASKLVVLASRPKLRSGSGSGRVDSGSARSGSVGSAVVAAQHSTQGTQRLGPRPPPPPRQS